MMFLGLRKLGNICCGHKMFLNKIKNIFVSATNVARTGKRGNICVGNNVSLFARAFRRESHACVLKTSISRRLTLAGQFLTPVFLDTISKNMLAQTHVRN